MTTSTPSSLRVAQVRVDRRNDGAYADTPRPRLSWIVESDRPNWRQRAAEIRLDGSTIVLDTDESAFVEWPFPPLRPHDRPTLSVRVTGTDGTVSAWSPATTVQPAFLADGEWRAPLIGARRPATPAQPLLLRTEFDEPRPVRRATLYATAHGVYQVSLNGVDADDAVLKPGWTSYQQRLLHESTDVTALLTPGRNAIGVRLAGGWWTERFGFRGEARRVYGEHPAVALQLRLEFADGTSRTVTTDGGWRCTDRGPIVSSGIYAGERIDARRRMPGWASPGFDDTAWSPVEVSAVTTAPEPWLAEPVRRTGELKVAAIRTSPSGRTILDFGQNFVGRLRLHVSGPAGHVVTVRHAEVLQDGEIATRPLRYAKATDEFVLSGTGMDTFEPEFTFHGFRYAEIDGWPGDLDPAAVTGVVIGSDMKRTGWFETSDDLVNRLHDNAVWSMRGNFLSLPTDCPQRDERLGWTGDVQVFGPSAAFLYDCAGFLASWLRDVAVEQARHGGVCPRVVPEVLPKHAVATAGWSDAAVIVPMTLHERFGDRRALAEQYPGMRSWVETLLRLADEDLLWRGAPQLGDWLDPAAPPDAPGQARADKDLVASAYLIRSLDLTARAAATLGRIEDAGRFEAAADLARASFARVFVENGDRLVSDAPTAYALAIGFDLVEGGLRDAFGRRLAGLVGEAGHLVPTGFLGTPVLLDALVSTAHTGTALRLLAQTQPPSWLYQVSMGATTIWERWDSMLPDGRINPGEMTSFNHYAFGSVVDWLHRHVGGLAPAEPGYRRITVAPVAFDAFEHARCCHETPYGTAEVSWRRSGGQITLRVRVPANTSAEVLPPGSHEQFTVGSGTHEWTVPYPATAAVEECA
ncbi:MAG TPA: family 78 glycoside hydrolase catalytic domain [Spirillospora sp.]|nr:family 78 glycoside hydrolase catalytic domain [Spirillospora sp.]